MAPRRNRLNLASVFRWSARGTCLFGEDRLKHCGSARNRIRRLGRGVWNGGTRMSSANPRTALFRSPSFPEGGLPEIIRGKYKLRILWRLQDGSLRFGALRKELAKGCVRPKEIAPRVRHPALTAKIIPSSLVARFLGLILAHFVAVLSRLGRCSNRRAARPHSPRAPPAER